MGYFRIFHAQIGRWNFFGIFWRIAAIFEKGLKRNFSSNNRGSMGSRKMVHISRVIKVKYEDEMRRIIVKSEDGRPGISLFDLRSKICKLFQLNGDAHELKLRYRDEDGDVITMANEDDFVDAFNQELCPFRVEVSLSRKYGSYLKQNEINIHELGPFGGAGGVDWNDGKYEGINGINVTFDSTTFRSIQVSYVTGNGANFTAARHGGPGEEIRTVFKYPNEKLQKISGYYGLVESTWTVIKGLSFETNLQKYGPFGVTDRVPFEFDLRSRDVIGVYGRACNKCLGSIGLYALSQCSKKHIMENESELQL